MGWQHGGEFTTEQHEQIARGFEAYLREGKAPAPEVRSMFKRMKAWLVDVYRSALELNVTLTDDVRGVFDRMIASDAEIEAAQGQQGIRDLPLDSAVPADKLAAYRDALESASEEAKAQLLAKMVNADHKAKTRKWRDARREALAEADAAFEALPQAKTWRALQGRGGEGVPAVKLNRADLVKVYGERWVVDNLRRLNVYAAEGGTHPETVAAAFGFGSADELVRALAGVRDTQARMREQAEATVRERLGDPMTDGTMHEKAMDFVHGAKRVGALEAELNLLAELAGEPVPPMRAVYEFARRELATKTLRKINPHAYLVAERKAANEAFKAAQAGAFSVRRTLNAPVTTLRPRPTPRRGAILGSGLGALKNSQATLFSMRDNAWLWTVCIHLLRKRPRATRRACL